MQIILMSGSCLRIPGKRMNYGTVLDSTMCQVMPTTAAAQLRTQHCCMLRAIAARLAAAVAGCHPNHGSGAVLTPKPYTQCSLTSCASSWKSSTMCVAPA